MNRAFAGMLILASFTPSSVLLAEDKASWQNLAGLGSSQAIEVRKTSGELLNGEFVRFADDSISVLVKKLEIAIRRTEVSRVRTRSKGDKTVWIWTAIGAGAGLGIGAAAGAGLANESGGDFANLKPAITVAIGAVGALIGAVVGSLTGHRTIYRVK